MHTLHELDLVHRRNEEFRRQAENRHLAQWLRPVGVRKVAGRSLLGRSRILLRPVPKEASVGNREK